MSTADDEPRPAGHDVADVNGDEDQLLDDLTEEDKRELQAYRVAKVGHAQRTIIEKNKCLNSPQPNRIQLHFSTKLLDALRPASFIHHVLLPGVPQHMRQQASDFQISWSYDQQLKPMVLNARQMLESPVSLVELQQQLSSQACGCHRYSAKYKVDYSTYGPHVCTRDLGIVRDPEVAILLSKGLNHIPCALDDVSLVCEQLKSAAEQFMTQLVEQGRGGERRGG
jgi:hypothetical protein